MWPMRAFVYICEGRYGDCGSMGWSYIDIGLYREGAVSTPEPGSAAGLMGVGLASPLRELEAPDEEFGEVPKMSSIRNEDDPGDEEFVCEGAATGGETEGCRWGPYSDVMALTRAECWGLG